MDWIKKDITKLFLFIFSSFILAALLTPQLYTAGKSLAEYTASNETAAALEWLGKKAERAQYGRYFKRSLVLCALILLYPLILWLRKPQTEREKTPLRQRITPTKKDCGVLFFGFLLASSTFALLGWLVVHLDFYQVKNGSQLIKTAVNSLTTAFSVSVIEELIFRGLLLGLLLKTMRPVHAILSLSAFFAAVHFLQPPKGILVNDPHAMFSGVLYLLEVLSILAAPEKIISSFFTLFMVGVVLAFAAFRTQKLWLPIGLHAGWVMVHKVMTKNTAPHPEHDHYLWIGKTITEGVLPLAMLCFTLFILRFALGNQDFLQKKA